jgi:hypothetical protein
VNKHSIQLEIIEPERMNIEKLSLLLRNGLLTKLDSYVTKHEEVPSWVVALKNEQYRCIELNPRLVFLLTNKPLAFSWHDLKMAIDYPKRECLHCVEIHDYQQQVVNYYNEQNDKGTENIRLWSQQINHIENSLSQALTVLEKTWPEGSFLVNSLIKEIILVNSGDFLSGSFPRFHGYVLLSPKADWEVPHFVEALVHEASHLEFNIRRMLEPFLLNPGAVAYSPIRREPRPLLGILHACFVLCRTTEALSRISHERCMGLASLTLLDKFVPVLQDSLEELLKYGQFTDAGEKLMRQMQAKASDSVHQPRGCAL